MLFAVKRKGKDEQLNFTQILQTVVVGGNEIRKTKRDIFQTWNYPPLATNLHFKRTNEIESLCHCPTIKKFQQKKLQFLPLLLHRFGLHCIFYSLTIFLLINVIISLLLHHIMCRVYSRMIVFLCLHELNRTTWIVFIYNSLINETLNFYQIFLLFGICEWTNPIQQDIGLFLAHEQRICAREEGVCLLWLITRLKKLHSSLPVVTHVA